MEALVTGGTGFIGRHVVRRLLRDGHRVRVYSRRSERPPWLSGGNMHPGDLGDFSRVVRAMEGCQVLYHVGEMKNVNRAASERNVKLMEHILGHVRKAGVGRVVFVSSITVAGIPSTVPAREDTEPRVTLSDHYTDYKRRCEELLAGQDQAEFAIIRPGPVYGPGSEHLRRFLRALETLGAVGLPFVRRGESLAPLVFVEDLGEAIALAGLHPGAGGHTLNLTDGARHSWRDFLAAAADAMGKKLRLLPVPPAILKLPAFFVDFLALAFRMDPDASHYVEFFSSDLHFDNALARAVLQWQPRHSLEEGVREMVRDYLEWREAHR
ncbi:MAG: NAD(P)-dependent oxidoreductase [Nitrospirota bacterium]